VQKVFLDVCLGQSCLQDWAHDVLHFFLADECGCQWALNHFRDGVVDRIPSFGGVSALSVDHIRPLEGLAFKGVHFICHQPVGLGPDAQCFACFRDLQTFNGFGRAFVVQEQGARLLGFGNRFAI